ncbi:aminotransferase [Streptomyces agglomeratus]|uniref:Aminotransferase n=1 Tax=Streptomyces agglomeratus TaxID=285458 RepID=A0A1E5P4C4_9ACTN|nr:aminotransferase class I/II-fold pyridoxal phosphate-dependent enzyme [Streptomyces agglomeratus]OEJ24408.1 aminotransferase [Streptomyces agglomeratus]OEJ41640.1 aminotransferase [Streptomyces agglomeratus]OEJ43981.1 aminotransferase [Streptomyces agglomeratus]OEJ54131.1 aminotransferase [Streptomyces agglomeratus]OEJ61503.1 aminotransferase [Streptomyces agglomeratus]
MDYAPFELLEWQSLDDGAAQYSLADSGCRPVTVRELLDGEDVLDHLLDTPLHYPPERGQERLRELIAEHHCGQPDDVIVTVGAAEANSIAIDALVRPGDHVVTFAPGYRQVWGCAVNAGARVEEIHSTAAAGWRPDLEALRAAVGPGTRLIALTNPNNPTGTILTEQEMDEIVAIAAEAGAWILADEVHRGTELLTDAVTSSFWGRYERVICVGSLSKAFGMPGLRVGWLVAPREALTDLWRRHEYATVSTGSVSMALAEIALTERNRTRLTHRYRNLIRESRTWLDDWVTAHGDLVSYVPPPATALGFVAYHLDLPSRQVAETLRARGDVLVGAGAHFGTEGHLRIAHGHDPAYLAAALDRTASVLKELAAVHGQRPAGAPAPARHTPPAPTQ